MLNDAAGAAPLRLTVRDRREGGSRQ